MLLLPEEYEILSILKAFMAYRWREPAGLLSAHREYEKFLSVFCMSYGLQNTHRLCSDYQDFFLIMNKLFLNRF